MKAYRVTSVCDFDEDFCVIAFGNDLKQAKRDAWSWYTYFCEDPEFTNLRFKRYPACDGMEAEVQEFPDFIALKNGDMWFEGISSDDAERMTFEEFLMAMDISKELIKPYGEIFKQKYASRLQKNAEC